MILAQFRPRRIPLRLFQKQEKLLLYANLRRARRRDQRQRIAADLKRHVLLDLRESQRPKLIGNIPARCPMCGITEDGVKAHMKTLFAKLNVSNRLEAASYALKHKLVR